MKSLTSQVDFIQDLKSISEGGLHSGTALLDYNSI